MPTACCVASSRRRRLSLLVALFTLIVVAAVDARSILGNDALRLALNAGLERTVVTGEYAQHMAMWLPNVTTSDPQYWSCVFDEGEVAVASLKFPSVVHQRGTLATVLQTGSLHVGSTMDFCPFLCIPEDGDSSAPEGFEVDLLASIVAHIADHYKVTLDIVWHKITSTTDFFDEVSYELIRTDSPLDMLANELTALPVRASVVDFSCSYFMSVLGVLRTRRDVELFLDSKVAIDASNVLVGVTRGTAAEIAVLTHFPSATLRLYDTLDDMVGAAGNAEVHVAIDDLFLVRDVVLQDEGAAEGEIRCPGCYEVPSLQIRASQVDHYAFATRPDTILEPGTEAEFLGLRPEAGYVLLVLIVLVCLAIIFVAALYYSKITVPLAHVTHGHHPDQALEPVLPIMGGGQVRNLRGLLVARPQWHSTADIPPSSSTSASDEAEAWLFGARSSDDAADW